MIGTALANADTRGPQSFPTIAETRGARKRLSRIEPRQLIGWALSFALVTYLAFSDGGYDTIPRSQVGVVVWWIVLVGAVLGILPRQLGRAGWLAVALLAGFALWTGLSISWSESAERSAAELGRVATYAGVLLLALTVVSRSGGRPVLHGAACAVGLVGLLAVLSRLHPTWFPLNQQLVFFQNARRLSYPINYWNGLAAFLAMGVPLLLAVAARARTIGGQALSAAVVPVLVLGIFFTVSRGGVFALTVGVIAYLLLTEDRLAAVATVAACGAGAAILIAYADARPILQQGLRSSSAINAGDHVLPVLLLVCAGVALLQAGIGHAANRLARPQWLRPSRRQGALRVGVVIAALLLAAVAAGAPGRIEHAWRDFKRPPGAVRGPSGNGDLFARLQSAAGNDRYQYWRVAARAAAKHPLNGIGAGSFVLLWTRNANAPGSVQDGHSLYMQTLAETGYEGLVLVVGLLLTFLLVGTWCAIRSPPGARVVVAAATAGVAAFSTSAAYEWVWQLGALAVLVLVLGAVSVAGSDAIFPASPQADGGDLCGRPRGVRIRLLAPRALLVGCACGAIAAVALPLAGAQDLARSRAASSRGDFGAALTEARSAEEVQPYATSARLQEALVREEMGDLRGARGAAVMATKDELTNWQTWVVLARIESELGNGPAALADFARAHALNPKGALFGG